MTSQPLHQPGLRPSTSRAPPPVPFARLVRVELRKMADTRAGLWLLDRDRRA